MSVAGTWIWSGRQLPTRLAMDLHVRGAASDQLCVTLASDINLTLLLDLDRSLIPFSAHTEEVNLDVDAVRLLDELHGAGTHIILVSGRRHTLVAPLCMLAPHAWWIAEHGAWHYDDARRWTGTSMMREITPTSRRHSECLRGFPARGSSHGGGRYAVTGTRSLQSSSWR
jgi:hypothetical protein